MTFDEFRQSLSAPEPPAGLSHALAGLWWDANHYWSQRGAPQQPQANESITLEFRILLVSPVYVLKQTP